MKVHFGRSCQSEHKWEPTCNHQVSPATEITTKLLYYTHSDIPHYSRTLTSKVKVMWTWKKCFINNWTASTLLSLSLSLALSLSRSLALSLSSTALSECVLFSCFELSLPLCSFFFFFFFLFFFSLFCIYTLIYKHKSRVIADLSDVHCSFFTCALTTSGWHMQLVNGL